MKAALGNAPFRLPADPGEADLLAKYFRVLGDRTRLRVLELVAEQERSVGVLVELLGEPQTKISNHLAGLRVAAVIELGRALLHDNEDHVDRSPQSMNIEILYFDGCPNHESLVPRLRELLAEAGADRALRLRRVETAEEAERERFLGSPTVRVDGRDVDPSADERTDYGLKCRLYATDDGLRGMPPDAWILNALAAGEHGAR